MEDLPFRLRALRRRRGLSLEQLGTASGLTKSYLSKLERGVSTPSISSVLKLSRAYGIGLAQLMGNDPDAADESISVVRADEREPLAREANKLGYRYEAMAGRRLVKTMEPFIVHPPDDFSAGDHSFPHAGEEFMFVLKGAVEVQIGERTIELAKGDSVYFDSELPHRMRRVGRAQAEVLVVVSSPPVP